VNKSAILQLAIKNTIQRSPHPDLMNIFDECDDIRLQFVGFVTAQIEHNVVTGLHIHSCALYYTHTKQSNQNKCVERETFCINIKLIFTKLRISFVEFNGTGKEDDEIIYMSTNRIYME